MIEGETNLKENIYNQNVEVEKEITDLRQKFKFKLEEFYLLHQAEIDNYCRSLPENSLSIIRKLDLFAPDQVNEINVLLEEAFCFLSHEDYGVKQAQKNCTKVKGLIDDLQAVLEQAIHNKIPN